MRTQGIALVIGMLGVSLLAAGCGGGDGSDSSTGPAISKVAFIKKADAVCTGGNKRMEVGFARFLQENKNIRHPTEADYEELVVKVLVPNVSKEIKEIRALGAPDGDEDRVDDFLEALEEGIEAAERDPKVVITNSSVVFGISSRLAKEYGLEVCSSR